MMLSLGFFTVLAPFCALDRANWAGRSRCCRFTFQAMLVDGPSCHFFFVDG